MCFPANIGILLRIPILKNTCERLYLKIITLMTNLSKVGYFWIFYPFKYFSILNFAMTKWFSPVTSFVKVFLLRSSHQRCSLRTKRRIFLYSLYGKKRRIPTILTKIVLRITSNAIFNMKKVDLDEP